MPKQLNELTPDDLDAAEDYATGAAENAANHYRLMCAAIEEIGIERERRAATLN